MRNKNTKHIHTPIRVRIKQRQMDDKHPANQSNPSSNTNNVLPGYYVHSDGGGYIHSEEGYPVRLSDLHIGTSTSKYC